MTASEVFMPQRSLTRLLRRETTTSTSPPGSGAAGCGAEPTRIRRRGTPLSRTGAGTASVTGASSSVGRLAGTGAGPSTCCAHASRLGAFSSTAHASRCRMRGRCSSQHSTEQKR